MRTDGCSYGKESEWPGQIADKLTRRSHDLMRSAIKPPPVLPLVSKAEGRSRKSEG